MDEIWERAVDIALAGQTDYASARSLTLDGAVKCFQGRLPPPSLLEKFQSLEHLSIANVGVSSLEKFPHLRNLQRLILSDNRIAGGLEFLFEAGLESLRDLDLSNNRIQYLEDLAPLAQLNLVSLDLYECPITRIKDYRSRVFGLIKSLKYLDKMDDDENERPESDEEEEDEDDEDDDPGSGEIDGEDKSSKMNNGGSVGGQGVVEADDDEESDADEEETETVRMANGSNQASHHPSNDFPVAASMDGDEDEENVNDEDDDDLGEEIDEEEDVVDIHEIEDSDDGEDVVEEVDEEEEMEEVEDEEDADPERSGHLMGTEGEIDGHEQGEEDENGEIGEEEELCVEAGEYKEDEDEEEDYGAEYLVQPVAQTEDDDGGSDLDPGNEEDGADVEDDEDRHGEFQLPPASSSQFKRKRDNDDSIDAKSSKHH
ncbi:hypothetical protein HHK36_002463 [Tetracentron sinense]|uniref:Acidic leucine-rich nuclear phosphoprotein 32-related protein n=1 Tax=Tetracentron sinense TaxID=13715 RepID=A0A834ZM30_TETSI|nr:hypothetical protein HHK36_002463 [Tetracentron sinense]